MLNYIGFSSFLLYILSDKIMYTSLYSTVAKAKQKKCVLFFRQHFGHVSIQYEYLTRSQESNVVRITIFDRHNL